MRKKRILYISNHKTLSRFEIPMLLDMGYEVFMPKKTDFDISATINFEYDKYLSIPQDEIEILNDVDFYYTPINEETSNLINKYFDIAFTVQYPTPFRSLVDHFKGVIVLRGYGMPESYTDVLTLLHGHSIYKKIENLGKRFWFGYGYETMPEIEGRLLRGRSIYMPLGLPNAVVNDRWIGDGKNILFPCPKIKTVKLFENYYENFKSDFKGLPYKVIGVQPIPVDNDNNVFGYLSNENYESIYRRSSCMFYPSQFKSHIHYTPAEAVTWGLPLLFMADGLLDYLGGKDLPGRCKTMKEARKNAVKLINNDKKFAEEIRESQPILLDKFTELFCRDKWKEAMDQIEKSAFLDNTHINKKKKRIAVILPLPYIGGVLDYSIRLIKAIALGNRDAGDNLDIVFSYVEDPVYLEKDFFKELRELNISIRSFKWEKLNKIRISDALKLKDESNYTLKLLDSYNVFCVPNDGISYFSDCDFLLFTADRVFDIPYINIPYGVVLHDYIQRLIPQTVSDNYINNCFLQFGRNAQFCITTSLVTKERAIQYAGIKENRVHIVPMMVDKVEINNYEIKLKKVPDKYFVWSTNVSLHKNHEVALEALSKYYHKGGKLKCCMTGVDTQLFNPYFKSFDNSENNFTEYVKRIRKIIMKDSFLKENIVFLGNMEKELYYNVLKKAKFSLHPGYADNGNYACVDAAYLGIPTVSSKYPAMEYIDNYYNLGMTFFDPFDSESLVKILLEYNDDNVSLLANKLPSAEYLDQFSITNKNVYDKIYEIIKFQAGL